MHYILYSIHTLEKQLFLKMTILGVERLIWAPGANPAPWKCNLLIQSQFYLVCGWNTTKLIRICYHHKCSIYTNFAK